jgi:DNA-binding HxlR family transcriptional regulator
MPERDGSVRREVPVIFTPAVEHAHTLSGRRRSDIIAATNAWACINIDQIEPPADFDCRQLH